MEIRRGKEKDIPFVCSLEERVFSDPWGESAVASHIDRAYLCLLIAEEAGEPLGYLLGSVGGTE